MNLTAKSGYRPQAEDKSVAIDLLEFSLLRRRSLQQRILMAAKLTQGAKALSLRGIKQARQEQYRQYFARAVLGDKWLPFLTPTSHEAIWIQDSTELARQLHPIFEHLQIFYYITGGFASTAYGEPRTTRNLDLVVEINRHQITTLVIVLEQAGFYCPPGAVEEIQLGQGSVLSITHIETILNADIVINATTPFDQAKMTRRRLETLDDANQTQFWLITPEDLILAKLLWRHQFQSDKQWRDVLGVMKVQGENLDFAYLNQWGKSLGILDVLNQVKVEAGF